MTVKDYSARGRVAMAEAAAQRMDAALVAAVSRRLGVTASLERYDRDARTGAQIPVFAVPASHIPAAAALGLTVVAQKVA